MPTLESVTDGDERGKEKEWKRPAAFKLGKQASWTITQPCCLEAWASRHGNIERYTRRLEGGGLLTLIKGGI